MSTDTETLERFTSQKYKYGFKTDIESDTLAPGLDESVIKHISAKKEEPEFMLAWRLEAFEKWKALKEPDWAFIEEGLEPPPHDHFSRYESGVLGDYALDLGNGYLIHGTLYQRFLGQSVTHGCVRLNDEDLANVYNSLEPGSRVYIY